MMIETTLKKYEKYVQGERRPPHTEKQHKQKQKLQEKHTLTDELLHETRILALTPNEQEHIHYLIDKFSNFRELHGNCKKETIILALIWYIAKINTPKRRIKDYQFNRKYGLTDDIFELIMCRITQRLLAESPIVPRHTLKYDNNILYRGNPKSIRQ